jgi:hypothetical protein
MRMLLAVSGELWANHGVGRRLLNIKLAYLDGCWRSTVKLVRLAMYIRHSILRMVLRSLDKVVYGAAVFLFRLRRAPTA